MPTDAVADAEELYRRVPSNCYTMQGGAVRFSSTTFNDRGRKPSVDRAILRESPAQTKNQSSDGVVTLIASRVRATSAVFDGKRTVDVHARPIEEGNAEGEPANLAHAQIEADPAFESDTHFKKLKESLARIADENGWTLAPSS